MSFDLKRLKADSINRVHIALTVVAITALFVYIPFKSKNDLERKHVEADTELMQLQELAAQAKKLQGMAVLTSSTKMNQAVRAGLGSSASLTHVGDVATLSISNATPSELFETLNAIHTEAGIPVKGAKLSIIGTQVSGQVELANK